MDGKKGDSMKKRYQSIFCIVCALCTVVVCVCSVLTIEGQKIYIQTLEHDNDILNRILSINLDVIKTNKTKLGVIYE